MNYALQQPYRPILRILVFAVIVSSCSATRISTGEFELLTESGATILRGTTDTYTRIEKLQRIFLVETAGKAKLTIDSFSPIVKDRDGQIYNLDLRPELRFREAALDVLLKYFLVLQAFAERNFAGDVDKVAVELAGSMDALANTSTPGDAQLEDGAGVLAAIVNVTGKEVVERKRLKTLQEVMSESQEYINELARLTGSSNDRIKITVDIMLKRILDHRNRVRPKRKSFRRYAFDMKVANILDETREIKISLDQLSTAIGKIPNAHAEVRETLGQRKSGMESLRSLVGEAVRIHVFYRTLGEESEGQYSLDSRTGGGY